MKSEKIWETRDITDDKNAFDKGIYKDLPIPGMELSITLLRLPCLTMSDIANWSQRYCAQLSWR